MILSRYKEKVVRQRRELTFVTQREAQVNDLYNNLKQKADLEQLIELEQIVAAALQPEEGTAAGRTHVR